MKRINGFWLIVLSLLTACSLLRPPTPTPAAPGRPETGQPSLVAPTASPSPTPVPATPEPPLTATSPLLPVSPAPLPESLTAHWSLLASGFDRPVYLTSVDDERLFVVEQPGVIWILNPDGSRREQPFLDITHLVGSAANEQGLFSMAFHPRYKENGIFFVDYTDKGEDSIIARYRVSNDSNVADPASAEVILKVGQPYWNHNGGQLQFGPDGYLYIAFGDGGSGGDPQGNGQRLDTLLGKILRLDVDSASPYAVPPDNPFGPNARLEIWHFGLRNPWRFSFDRATGDMYIGDVGQDQYEEIDFQPAGVGGLNFGWNIMEGNHPYAGGSATGLTAPIYENDRSGGECSITGGYVYRGQAIPELNGVYLFGDYCSGVVWGAARDASGQWQTAQLFSTGFSISSFGEDAAGEVYLLDLNGGVYRLEPGSQ